MAKYNDFLDEDVISEISSLLDEELLNEKPEIQKEERRLSTEELVNLFVQELEKNPDVIEEISLTDEDGKDKTFVAVNDSKIEELRKEAAKKEEKEGIGNERFFFDGKEIDREKLNKLVEKNYDKILEHMKEKYPEAVKEAEKMVHARETLESLGIDAKIVEKSPEEKASELIDRIEKSKTINKLYNIPLYDGDEPHVIGYQRKRDEKTGEMEDKWYIDRKPVLSVAIKELLVDRINYKFLNDTVNITERTNEARAERANERGDR